jgi:hypothetical protein
LSYQSTRRGRSHDTSLLCFDCWFLLTCNSNNAPGRRNYGRR